MKAYLLALLALFAEGQPTPSARATDRLTDRISAASLRGRVSFLASDVLEGRDTPSRGLDIAAEYIASEFRRANLESPPGGRYFQTADFIEIADRPDTFQFSISGAGEAAVSIPADRISVESLHGARLINEPVFKWAPSVNITGSLAGKILMLRAPSDRSVVAKLAVSKPDGIIQLVRQRIVNEREVHLIPGGANMEEGPIELSIPASEVEATFDRLPTGLTSARATVQIGSPIVKTVHLRNVAGILRGSDPKLREEYVLISAHYDHLGTAGDGSEDRIYNGANDDASGVATAIELAHAFAGEEPRPLRTLVFLCFFGEEKGLFGSTWYVKHPLFPLAHTIADINLEQLGESQPSEGLPDGSIGLTGYQFSNLPEIVSPDFESAGVTLREVHHNQEYFDRSDNLAFAQAGVPAHTFVASVDFPDYHRTSDKWPKLNYENMAKLDRGLALAILDLASRPDTPRWNESSKKAKEYLNAWRALHH